MVYELLWSELYKLSNIMSKYDIIDNIIEVTVKPLTHWGREMHICVGNVTTTDSDNGLSPGRRQAIIWTNSGLLLIGPFGTYFN